MSSHHRAINFSRIRSDSIPYIPAILNRLLAGGYIQGSEYVVKNPKRADTRAGSFKVNIHTGKWADWAVGARGNDITSLIAYLLDYSQADAARWVAEAMGDI